MADFLPPEEYIEPACPLCMKTKNDPVSIPLARVMDKLEEYFSKNDYAAAERHLLYWLDEARAGRDERGEFSIFNELMGLYRKVGKEQEALDACVKALILAKKLEIANSAAGATALLNAATVYKAFGQAQKALPLFEKAEKIYLCELDARDERIGGLYNNFALALVDCKQFSRAREYYQKALEQMKNTSSGELEQAITLLNLAELEEIEFGLEEACDKISNLVEQAWELFNLEKTNKNGYYAFVCEKCASTFGYYGYFLYELELKNRAEEIYARS